jgi:hypothetical protein
VDEFDLNVPPSPTTSGAPPVVVLAVMTYTYLIAIGFTGEPTAPVTLNGGAIS